MNRNYRYIDLHCDTITKLCYPWENLYKNRRMVDIASMQKGGTLIQCFAAFVPTGCYPAPLRNSLTWRRFLKLADRKDRLLSVHSDALRPVLAADDVEQCRADGRIGAMFTIEDAGVFGSDITRVKAAYDRGVRIASLTWNHENTLAFPNSPKQSVMRRGLKPFGFQVIEEMKRIGMIIDVSHLSDGGFWDVANAAKASHTPFVATHSNSRAMTGHPRNLTDDMIRMLAEQGGVMGLNFCPLFLRKNDRDQKSRIEDMVRHVLHIRSVGGSGVLAIGTDFDGIDGKLEIGTPEGMPRLADALEKAGLKPSEIEAMWNGNFCRVLRDSGCVNSNAR